VDPGAVHALLAHLHEAAFDGAPRPLGIDERGREVLTFIPGTPTWPGQFHLLDDDAHLAAPPASSATSTTP
jgi:hypothetical protein